MTTWPTYPVVYEINTWAWLEELSRLAGRFITLANVPQAELERIASYGFDAVWLMGVWERSPEGRKVARDLPGLQQEYRNALPDYSQEDVVGSPYSIHAYRVDPTLGGDEALATLRGRLRALGLRLMLDFVPNHLARDHAWIARHPQRLVQGGSSSLARQPGNYFEITTNGQWQVFAHGRDPSFDGWSDTVQLDYRSADTRRALTDVLLALAARCDGVRCDMAMLVTHDTFLRTWGGQFEPPRAEFWPAAITDLHALHPGFLMLAEVYWDLEWELQQQGFDYTYDKHLYDKLLHSDAMEVRLHLNASMDFQRHLARFVENHDERRAAEAFGVARSRAMAVLALTLPGLRLVHEGQFEGRRVKLPVQLGRRPSEPVIDELDPFYRRLIAALRHPVFHEGEWRLLKPTEEWAGNSTHRNIVASRWSLGDDQWLVIVNLSAQPAECFVPVDVMALAGRSWRLVDVVNEQQFVREGDELTGRGLYVDLPGYGYHVFELQAA